MANDTEVRFKPIRFDGTVNLMTVIHLIVLVVTIVGVYYAVDKRTALVESEIFRMRREIDSMQSKLEATSDAIFRLTISQERLNTILAESLRRGGQ